MVDFRVVDAAAKSAVSDSVWSAFGTAYALAVASSTCRAVDGCEPGVSEQLNANLGEAAARREPPGCPMPGGKALPSIADHGRCCEVGAGWERSIDDPRGR